MATKKACSKKGFTRSKSGKCRKLKPCPDGFARSRSSGQCYSKAKKAKAYYKANKSKSKSKSTSKGRK